GREGAAAISGLVGGGRPPRFSDRGPSCRDRELRRPAHGPRPQTPRVRRRVELLHLTADVDGELRRIERFHRANPARAVEQRAPERFRADADRRNNADARDDDAWTRWHAADSISVFPRTG